MEKLIEAKNLKKNFEQIKAVDDITIDLNQGEVLGFLGPNGAGKSTTMKMITGFLTPSSGEIKLNGVNLLEKPNIAKLDLGYLPEGAPAYGEMTPFSYLKFIAEVRKIGRDKVSRVHEIIERINLTDVVNQPIETLSKGYKRRVGLAQAIIHDPKILIMDEPTDGLDPNQKFEIRNLIREMAPRKAIIISTHILEEVDAICTQTLIIKRGRIVFTGTPRELSSLSDFHNAITIIMLRDDAEKFKRETKNLLAPGNLNEELRGNEARLTYILEGSKLKENELKNLLAKLNIKPKQYYLEKGSLEQIFRKLTH
ncbi:MAG: ABC transporter ATP-binding protein [Rhodobacteraceae bacterium]|nr:ABC transporter ATP-binding protein [Paracoccaceae bacterium]